MAARNYVPSKTLIKCDKGTIPNALIVVNPTSTILGRQWATTGDNVVGQSFQSFGNCACKIGMPCIPSVTKWLNTAGSDIVCIGNELLIDESELPCTIGGKITIVLTPPPADAPKPPSGALSELKKKMGGIVGKLMAPINSLKGALNGAIGGMVGGALGGAVSDMTADAIGQAVGNKIMSDIQSKALNKLMEKRAKSNQNQKLGTANVYQTQKVDKQKTNSDKFIAVNINQEITPLDFMIGTTSKYQFNQMEVFDSTSMEMNKSFQIDFSKINTKNLGKEAFKGTIRNGTNTLKNIRQLLNQ